MKIRKFQRVTTLLISLFLTGCMLSGCANKDKIKEASSEAVRTDSGKVLNIYCWNTEFEERMTDYYPGYVDGGMVPVPLET